MRKNQLVKNKNAGFSLIEVIVVIFIVSLGFVGILSLTMQSIRVQHVNKNTLVASQLAQEGIELLRNIRDSNWLSLGSNWDDNLAGGDYRIDFDDLAPAASNMEGAGLYLDANGFYQHEITASPTNFSRLITISDVTADSLKVVSRVQWTDRGDTYSYVAETDLYDWR